jgi:hypothetical protein
MEKKNKHPFIQIMDGVKQELIEKIEQLYNEWKGRDSCEAKYRCEAYKELIDYLKEGEQ